MGNEAMDVTRSSSELCESHFEGRSLDFVRMFHHHCKRLHAVDSLDAYTDTSRSLTAFLSLSPSCLHTWLNGKLASRLRRRLRSISPERESGVRDQIVEVVCKFELKTGGIRRKSTEAWMHPAVRCITVLHILSVCNEKTLLSTATMLHIQTTSICGCDFELSCVCSRTIQSALHAS